MSEQELQLLFSIRDLPLITAQQLAHKLCRHPQAVRRTLEKFSLGAKPLLQRMREDAYTPYVYALSREGVKHFGGQFVNLKERSSYFLTHEIFCNEAMIVLSLSYEIELCLQGRTAWDQEIHPDRFLILKSGERRRALFVEVETGTNADPDFKKKVENYLKYRERHFGGKPEGWRHPKYGVKTFSVLTVGTSEAHARKLADLSAPVIPSLIRKLFLFSALPIESCIVPHEVERHPLISL
jgi:hypothetical protein